jgi:hypothetical protein
MSDEATTTSEKRPLGLEVRWALVVGCGSFLLYLFGYLVLRFHLTVLGVDTGLSTLDERYLFAGAQFLVYLLTSLPLAFVVLFALQALVRRTHPPFLQRPEGRLVAGIAISIVLIQTVMRQCLLFTNLLLRSDLPDPEWMQGLLLPGVWQTFYFTGLVAATLAIFRLLWVSRQDSGGAKPSRLLFGTLACLALIQFLLLPVNFGVLVVDQKLPRVTSLDGKEPLKANVQAWRIWEGSDSVTYFVRRADPGIEAVRTLVTLDKKSVVKTEIVGYDPLIDLVRLLPGASPGTSP